VTITAVASKDLLLLWRDRGALLFVLIVPIAVVGIVAASLSGGGASGVLLPVVNEDGGPVAETLIELLSERIRVVEVDRTRAESMVAHETNAAAALLLPAHLSKRYLGGRPSQLLLLTDPAKGNELNVVRAYLMIVEREAAALADPFSEELLELEERNLTGSRLSTTSVEQNIPGFSVMFVLMAVLFGLAFAIQDEKDQGTIQRLRIAPSPAWQILAGKLLARFAVGAVQLTVLLGFGHLAFALPLGPSPAAFLAVVLAIAFGLTGFSLLVSAFVRSREQIIPLGLTVVMLVCSLGGCWWPLFYEPLWLQQAAHLMPTAWAMDALTNLVSRGRGLAEVATQVGVLTAYGAVSAALGVRLQRL
jgi:ABC-2 type transport system permease protein